MQEFRVVKIIDDKTIIINAGENDGIEKDTTFEICETGNEIVDPITNESLGTLDLIKDNVIAIKVLPKMCICTKHLTKEKMLTSFKDSILNVEQREITGGLYSDNPIKVGDKARCNDELF